MVAIAGTNRKLLQGRPINISKYAWIFYTSKDLEYLPPYVVNFSLRMGKYEPDLLILAQIRLFAYGFSDYVVLAPLLKVLIFSVILMNDMEMTPIRALFAILKTALTFKVFSSDQFIDKTESIKNAEFESTFINKRFFRTTL